MTRIEQIESDIQGLSPQELADFRRWFAEFDAVAWDGQFESDANAGRLDGIARQALQAHAAGRTGKL